MVEPYRGWLGIPMFLNPKSLQEETTEHQHYKPGSVTSLQSLRQTPKTCDLAGLWGGWLLKENVGSDVRERVKGARRHRSGISVLGRQKLPGL